MLLGMSVILPTAARGRMLGKVLQNALNCEHW